MLASLTLSFTSTVADPAAAGAEDESPLADHNGEDPDDNDLRTTLLAPGSRLLSLPHWSTFAPLVDAGRAAAGKGGVFARHETFVLPCDYGCAGARGSGKSKQGLSDVIHRFELTQALSAPLNEQIRQASLEMEAAADGAGGEGYNGERKTNWGGYQSSTTIFEGCEDQSEYVRLRGCRQVHEIASLAMEVMGEAAEGRESLYQYPDESRRPRAGELHSAYAWLNVNRSSDLNFMHVHDPLRWSAVYFVDEGASVDESNGGRLLFRGGRHSSSNASHSYLAVPPTPGTLWLFPGSIPHAVLGQIVSAEPPRDALGRSDHSVAAAEACAKGEMPENARISIAINFSEAIAPKSCRLPANHGRKETGLYVC